MNESNLSRWLLGTALLAVGWGLWLKLDEPPPAEKKLDWVIRGGRLVERESSEPFQGKREIPFDTAQNLIQWEYHYVDGIRQGAAIEYFATPDMRVKSREIYVDGKRQGQVITYHNNGVPQSAGSAVDGFLNGLISFYNRDGTVRERSVYEQSLPSGIAAIALEPPLTLEPEAEYDELNPEPDEPGPRAQLDPAGEPFTGTQLGTFFGGGKASEHAFVDGFEDGRHRGWSPAGESEYERPYLAGQKHGAWKIWAEGGQLISEQTFHHGRRIGSLKAWFPDGQLRRESQFVSGAEHGTRTEFDARGSQRRVTVFDHGVQLSMQEWDQDGQLIKEESTELASGGELTIEPGEEVITRSVPIADLPTDLEGEVTISFRYRLSATAAEEDLPAVAARPFKASLLHGGTAREFNHFEGEIGGWRTREWISTIAAGEELSLQVEAQPGTLQIRFEGIIYTNDTE